MLSNHPVLLNNYNRLYHVSEQADIQLFAPRPSPSFFPGITADVVFAISGQLLHNYLLPRDCPRVTWYAGNNTTEEDKNRFMANTSADFVITVESGWYQQINNAVLYCYEFDPAYFTLIDECAGYYISYQPIIPTSVIRVNNVMEQLLMRNVELRFTPSLKQLAAAVSNSTIKFSLIRMRNAI